VPGLAARLIDRALAEVAADIAARPDDGLRPIALGWATVELDRAAEELAGQLGFSRDAFAPAPDSEALGARALIAPGVIAGGLALAILEPSREGSLAATLARQDEGPAAVWLASAASPTADARTTVAGPFGLEREVPGGRIGGLRGFLVVTEPGTIGG
jgi:hypothetical protein